MPVVDDHTRRRQGRRVRHRELRRAVTAFGGLRDQQLEVRDAARRRAVHGGEFFELAAVVESEYRERRPAPRAGAGAVQLLQRFVVAQPRCRRAVLKEVAQLVPARHRRRATVARHDDRAARVRVTQRVLQRLVTHPAAQQPGHEGVACAEHVEDLDRETRALNAVVELCGNGLGAGHAAHRPALHHDQRFRQIADAAQRGMRVRAAAGDVHFFFGADDQVAQRQHGLKVPADVVGLDVALLAEAGCGQAPQHRAVVDVERHACAGGARGADRGHAGLVGLRLRQVRAREQQHPR